MVSAFGAFAVLRFIERTVNDATVAVKPGELLQGQVTAGADLNSGVAGHRRYLSNSLCLTLTEDYGSYSTALSLVASLPST